MNPTLAASVASDISALEFLLDYTEPGTAFEREPYARLLLKSIQQSLGKEPRFTQLVADLAEVVSSRFGADPEQASNFRRREIELLQVLRTELTNARLEGEDNSAKT